MLFRSVSQSRYSRKILVTSTDGIDGVVEGKFDFNQIQNMVKNSLGSLYTNYKPYKIKKGQYMKFNFNEFDKIIEILNPKVSFSHDAVLTGSINADANDFKMDFKSDSIKAFDVHLDKVLLQVVMAITIVLVRYSVMLSEILQAILRFILHSAPLTIRRQGHSH